MAEGPAGPAVGPSQVSEGYKLLSFICHPRDERENRFVTGRGIKKESRPEAAFRLQSSQAAARLGGPQTYVLPRKVRRKIRN